MKRLFIYTLPLMLLLGCADTPENRQFWQQLGAGLQGAGNNLNQQAAQMRQNNANNGGNTVQTNCYRIGNSVNCTSQNNANNGGNTVQTNCYKIGNSMNCTSQ